MTSIQKLGPRGRVIALSLGASAMFLSVSCAARDDRGVSAPQLTTAALQAGSPVVVSCEPNQRTLVRPVIVNGATLSQVECITNGAPVATVPMALPAPRQVAPSYGAAIATQPVALQPAYTDAGDARLVTVSEPTVARPVLTRQVVSEDVRPVRRVQARPTRSVKKSAVIIGSSAGAGAGLGAAIGGKKGALIGALVGGGGATLWDQITRSKDR